MARSSRYGGAETGGGGEGPALADMGELGLVGFAGPDLAAVEKLGQLEV